VLHRPIETTALTREVGTRIKMSSYPTLRRLPTKVGTSSQFVRRRCFWLESQEVLNRVELVDLRPSYDQVRLKLESFGGGA
jgi:hypothetical protein